MGDNSIGTPPETPEAIHPSKSEFLTGLFLNKTSLRAGWRLLIYGATFLVLLSVSVFLLDLFLPSSHGVLSPSSRLFGELASFLAAFLAAWIMSRLEASPIGLYGLPVRRAFGKEFWCGCLFGLGQICALIGLIAVFGSYSFGSLAEHDGAIIKWAVFWGLFFFVVALFEEFFFRGYTLHTLTDGIGFWPAAILLAVAFGLVHKRNPGENWVGVAGVALVGLFWSFTVRRTGNLWFALGMHASFDFGETFLFSVPDSGMIFPGHLSNATLHGPNWLTGGSPGPEASIFDFLILALFFFLVHRMYPARQKQTGSIEVS